MVLNIVAVLLIAGITFFHSIFGLFSGLINVMCTILSVCIAFGFWEPLNDWVTKDFELHAGYSGAICLVLLFCVSLIVLRSLADNLIRGNVRVPMYVDWAGGAICGFINAQCFVGIIVIGFFMLPFGDSVLMFKRYEKSDELENGRYKFPRRTVWLNPDGFVTGLFNMLSNGAARGNTTFASVYPSFTDWVSWTGNTVQVESLTAPLRDKKGDGFKDIKAPVWWEQKNGVEAQYRKITPTRLDPDPKYERQTFTPSAGMKLVGVQIALGALSADRSDKSLPNHRFRPTQFRLVGEENGHSAQYYPRIISGADANISGAARIVDLDSKFSIDAAEGETNIDAYFEVEEGFQPRFLEYRRYARVALAPDAMNKATAARTLTVLNPEQKRMIEYVGQTGFIGTTVDGTGDVDVLPFPMSVPALREAEIVMAGETLGSGRLYGPRAKFNPQPPAPRAERFKLPEGFRLLQIRCRPKLAQTVFGQVFNFVGGTLNQYKAVDNRNAEYPLVGYFAIVKRDNQDYIELFYTGNPRDESFRGMLDFKEIKKNELTASEDTVLGLLFLVPPKSNIVKIVNQTNQGVTIDINTGG